MNHSPLQGAEDLNNDFYLKENVDGTVIFESVPNKGRFVTIPYGSELLRNFSINLVVSLVLVYRCYNIHQDNKGVVACLHSVGIHIYQRVSRVCHVEVSPTSHRAYVPTFQTAR